MQGIVIKSTGSWYKVITPENQIIDCRIKGKLRLDDLKSTNPIAVGDNVYFDPENETSGVITEIIERKNYIIRKASNLSKQSHILAANVDRAYIIVTLHSPKTLMSFVDRFLASVEAYGIPCTIIINKCDLYVSPQEIELLEHWESTYQLAGYETLRVSTVSGLNIEELRIKLENSISVLSGNSGVGKTTLLNTIDNKLNLKTTIVSKSHNKGQHTTTFAEMYTIENQGFIIDTPGVKAFGLHDIEKENLSHYFPEIFAVSKNCQYHNCTHIHEPNCAVVEAVKLERIAMSRYENYVGLFIEDNTKHR